MKREQLSVYDDQGEDTFAKFVVFVFSWLPYSAIAWLYMELVDGRARDFWIALGVLLVLRLFFSTIEALGGFLLWRMYGRRFVIRKTLAVFRTNGFPPRQPGEDVFTYLYRIQRAPDCPPLLRDRAQELELEVAKSAGKGQIHVRRITHAMQAALERYETPVANSVAS